MVDNPMNVEQAAAKIFEIANKEPAQDPVVTQEPATGPSEPQQIDSSEERSEETAPQEEVRKDAEAAQESQSESQDDADEIELEPAHFAQLLGLNENDVEVDEAGDVRFTAKIDGDVQKVSLGDLRDSYQLAKTSQKRLNKLADERKAWEQEKHQTFDALSQQHQQLVSAIRAIETEFMGDVNSVDWTRLRDEDPTEYNLRRSDFEDKRKKIEQFKANAQQQAEHLKAEYDTNLRKMQYDGAKRLEEVFSGPAYEKSPKWGDDEQQVLFKWIVDQGYAPEQISNVTDWRFFKWARDSYLREQEQQAAKKAVKRITKIPRVIKPGSKKSSDQQKRTSLDQAKARQRKAKGSLDATTELIREIMRS